MFTRRMSFIVGHFGSGKTEIAVNGALEIARRGEPVTLIDLDVVKPYFRSRSLRAGMSGRGVQVVAPEGEGAPADIPPALPDLRVLLDGGGPKVIVDVGGDPVGTLVLGSVSEALCRDDLAHLLVLNFARPHTDSVDRAVAMARAIQAAARLPLTGLVANTHLLGETTPETVTEGLRLTERAARVLGLPVALAAVEERLVGALPSGWAPCPVLPLRRLVFPPYEAMPRPPGSVRRLFLAPARREPLRRTALAPERAPILPARRRGRA